MTDDARRRLSLLILDLLRVAGSVQASKLSATLRGQGHRHDQADCNAAVRELVKAGRVHFVADGWIREV